MSDFGFLGRTLIYFIATVSFMLNPEASQSSGNWNCLQVDCGVTHTRARACQGDIRMRLDYRVLCKKSDIVTPIIKKMMGAFVRFQ